MTKLQELRAYVKKLNDNNIAMTMHGFMTLLDKYIAEEQSARSTKQSKTCIGKN